MQIRIGRELGTTFWTHQDRIDMEYFSLNLSNANGLDILMYLLPVYIVYSYCTYYIVFLMLVVDFFVLDKKG